MKIHRQDIATRIYNLSLEIKHLVDDNHIEKKIVIEDFQDLIMSEFKNCECTICDSLEKYEGN